MSQKRSSYSCSPRRARDVPCSACRSAGIRPQDLVGAWRLFFERLADTSPTVLAFEDMQWADTSLLDFVEYLLEWSRDYPLYVITLARPELQERRPSWGAGQRNFSSLYLEPLSQAAMQELLEGLVPGLPERLRAQILARAEGVPLYAVETVRMLLDRGLLAQEGPIYKTAGEIETLEVPETLHALIAARLDGELAPPLATSKAPVAAVRGADQFSFWAPGVWGDVEREMLETIAPLGRARGARDKALAAIANTSTQAARLRNQLAVFTGRPQNGNRFGSPVPYPDHRSSFPQRLAGLAAMLAAGLPLRCVALRAYGMYDTHSDQPDSLAQGLKLTSDTLLAFQRDLEARGLADRVLTLVWSEFGRRGEENGSLGTDHGAAGVSLLMGTRARGQMIGELPRLRDGLDKEGNLKATVDFRSIYTSLLEQWFDFDAAAVIPNARAYRRLQLVK